MTPLRTPRPQTAKRDPASGRFARDPAETGKGGGVSRERAAGYLSAWRAQELRRLRSRTRDLGSEDRADLYSAAVEHVDRLIRDGHLVRDERHLLALLRQALLWKLGEHVRASATRHETPLSMVPLDRLSDRAATASDAADGQVPVQLAEDFLLELSELERRVFRCMHGEGLSQRRAARHLGITRDEARRAERVARRQLDRSVVLYSRLRWCKHRRADLTAFAEGTATVEQVDKALAHLGHCRPCRAEHARRRQELARAVAALIPPIPLAAAAGSVVAKTVAWVAARAASVPHVRGGEGSGAAGAGAGAAVTVKTAVAIGGAASVLGGAIGANQAIDRPARHFHHHHRPAVRPAAAATGTSARTFAPVLRARPAPSRPAGRRHTATGHRREPVAVRAARSEFGGPGTPTDAGSRARAPTARVAGTATAGEYQSSATSAASRRAARAEFGTP
ncbi:MAG: sigma-70 family RNA polymerase sigma factor [Actinobacteria bacterium]|nr:MAG: sigma-70 family RNA polymerase sigma factor [Actinomycetota bacterium]